MTTLTTSGSATARRRPTGDLRGRRVESDGPAGRRWSGCDSPLIFGPCRGLGGRREEGGQVVGIEAGRAEDGQDDGPLGAERPRPAREADLFDPERRERPEPARRAVASRIEGLGRRPAVRLRDERLEVGVGARDLAVGRARAGRIEGGAAHSRRSQRRARGRRGRSAPMRAGEGIGVRVAASRPTSPPVRAVRRWHLVRPSLFGACLRPTIDAPEQGRGCHCPSSSVRDYGSHTPTRDRTRRSLGRRSRNWKRSFVRGGSGEGSRIQLTSRVTGSSANRPGGPSGRQRSSLGDPNISIKVALRYRRAIVAFPAMRAQAVRPRSLGRRAGAPEDPPAIEVGLDHPRRADQVRIAGDRPRHPVDVGRLEGRDLAERVVVELAERDDRRLGLLERGRRSAAGSGAADRGRAARSASTRAAARGRRRSARSGGWPGSGRPSRRRCRPAWFRGRNVSLVSTRPVTGRVGFGAGGPPRRRATPGSNGVPSASDPRPLRPARSISRVSAA